MNRIIGIDLGTTNTCAASVSNKIPRVIPIEGGYSTMPSCVAVAIDGSVLVGQSAKEQMILAPQRSIYGVKRLVGRQFNSRTVQEYRRYFSYDIIAGEHGEAAIRIGERIWTCDEVQSRILSQVKRYAEIHLGEDVPEVVIAVPAYFSDHQRALVKQAGERSGWNVRKVINEPTAAALAYGFNRGFDQKVLVYDLGGGTFDVSILEVTGNVFQVIATGGDIFLGGADFDNRVLTWMVEQFRRETKMDVLEDPRALQRLRDAAERAKIELSLLANTQVKLGGLVERRGKLVDLDLVLDRETLNRLTSPLVDRTITLVDELLASVGLAKESIDEIILVGGQTRMPLVVDRLTNHFGKGPRKGVHPDESVALGAALYADSLAKIDAVTLLDTLSTPVGVASSKGTIEVVVPRNARLPHAVTIALPATRDAQGNGVIEVYQGDAGPVSGGDYLGTLVYPAEKLTGHEGALLQVTFALDAEGMLEVRATHDPASEPQQVQLATIERPSLPQDGVDASVRAPEAPTAGGRSGLRDLVKGLWGGR